MKISIVIQKDKFIYDEILNTKTPSNSWNNSNTCQFAGGSSSSLSPLLPFQLERNNACHGDVSICLNMQLPYGHILDII